MSARMLPFVYGVLACLSWAFGNVLTKAVLSHVEPLSVLSGQLTCSVIGLWAFSRARGSEIRLDDWRVGLPGLLQPGLAFGMSTFGLALVPASLEAMIFAIETPLILLLAWPMLGERPNRSIAALGLVSFVGVIVLTWRPEVGSTSGHGFAVLLIVSGAIFAALYSIAIRWMSVDVDALRLNSRQPDSRMAGGGHRLVRDTKARRPKPEHHGRRHDRRIGTAHERNPLPSLWHRPRTGQRGLRRTVAPSRSGPDRRPRV